MFFHHHTGCVIINNKFKWYDLVLCDRTTHLHLTQVISSYTHNVNLYVVGRELHKKIRFYFSTSFLLYLLPSRFYLILMISKSIESVRNGFMISRVSTNNYFLDCAANKITLTQPTDYMCISLSECKCNKIHAINIKLQ